MDIVSSLYRKRFPIPIDNPASDSPKQRIPLHVASAVVRHVQLGEQGKQHLNSADRVQRAVYGMRNNGFNVLGKQKLPLVNYDRPHFTKYVYESCSSGQDNQRPFRLIGRCPNTGSQPVHSPAT